MISLKKLLTEGTLNEDIKKDIDKFITKLNKQFPDQEYTISSGGGKYVRITHKNRKGGQESAWGFIALVDNPSKGFQKGDLLKAAGYNTPAKTARGNILNGTAKYDKYSPAYLREEFETLVNESKVKTKKTISKQEWSKIPKYNKHIGQDGTKYIMQYSDNLGTYLQAVIVEGESVNEEKKYKKGDKLKIKLKNGKKIDVVFDMYARTKGVALGKFKDSHGEYDIKPFDLDTIIESVNEGNWSKIMAGVRKGNQAGPWTIVIIQNKKVIHQEPVKYRDAIPAHYESMKREFRNASLAIEDKTGQIVYSEKI